MHIPIYSVKDGGYKLVFVQGSREQAREFGRAELQALQEAIHTALNEPEKDDEALPDNRRKLSKLKLANREGLDCVLKETTTEDLSIILKYADDPVLLNILAAGISPRGVQILKEEINCLPPVTAARARQAVERIIHVADEYEKRGMLEYTDTLSVGHKEEVTMTQREDKIEDYMAYVGKNSEYYTERFRKFRQTEEDEFALTWNWPAFLFPAFWMLYRKLYAWFVPALVIAFALPGFSHIAWAAAANYIYYKKVGKEVEEVKAATTEAFDIAPVLRMKGGVNEWVRQVGLGIGIIAGLGFVSFIAWGVFSR